MLNYSPTTPLSDRSTDWGGMLLVEASPMIGAALSHWFQQIPFVSDVDVVSGFEPVLPLMRKRNYDFLVLPDQIAGKTPASLLQSLRHCENAARVVFLIGQANSIDLMELDRLNPAGMIDRQARPDDVRSVLRDVLRGDQSYTPNLIDQLTTLRKAGISGNGTGDSLSARQREVLRYLALGHTVKEVAAMMHLSVKSIDSHKYRIMKKLNLHDRVHLARYAIREGLCEA